MFPFIPFHHLFIYGFDCLNWTKENERLTCTRDVRADMYWYQYFAKSISMAYPSTSTRTDISGHDQWSANPCASFYTNTLWFTYSIYIFIQSDIHTIIYLYKFTYINICLYSDTYIYIYIYLYLHIDVIFYCMYIYYIIIIYFIIIVGNQFE